jgi:hypothetical protein
MKMCDSLEEGGALSQERKSRTFSALFQWIHHFDLFLLSPFQLLRSGKSVFIIFYSGAISYALSVHVGQYYGEDEAELKQTIVTTTLITVLFTIIVLGGLTMPVVKYLRRRTPSSSPRQPSLESTDEMNLHSMMSKTIQFDDLLNNDENYIHQRKRGLNDDDDDFRIHFANPNQMKGLERLNEFYIKPLLVRSTSLKHDQSPILLSDKRNPLFRDDDDDENDENDLLVVSHLRDES